MVLISISMPQVRELSIFVEVAVEKLTWTGAAFLILETCTEREVVVRAICGVIVFNTQGL